LRIPRPLVFAFLSASLLLLYLLTSQEKDASARPGHGTAPCCEAAGAGNRTDCEASPEAHPPTGRKHANGKEDALSRDREVALAPLNRVFRKFEAWAQNPVDVQEGERLATERRQALMALIRKDPEAALKAALPIRLRKDLPPSVSALLEERVQGRGDYQVLASLPPPPEMVAEDPDAASPSPLTPSITRSVSMGDRHWEAFVYGRRLEEGTKQGIPLFGITLDGLMALHQSPLRALEPGEVPDPGLLQASSNCPVSRKNAPSGLPVQVADTLHRICQGSHLASFEKTLLAQETGIGPAPVLTPAEIPVANPWTMGPKRVLLLRVSFLDQPSAPIPETNARSMMQSVGTFFRDSSYGATSWTVTVSSLIQLPQPMASYNRDGIFILNSARIAAEAAGYRMGDYDLDCAIFIPAAGPSWALGQGYVGARGCWVSSWDPRVVAHEFGHNYGLWHSNAWRTSNLGGIGSGVNGEYGDTSDVMGSGPDLKYQFNAIAKSLLGWLPDAHVLPVSSSGTYRVYAFDQSSTLDPSQPCVLKIRKDGQRDYWLSSRQLIASPQMQNGLNVHWKDAGSASPLLIDPYPITPSFDPLVLGQTLADPYAGVHITPVAKGGIAPVWFDVVVHLGDQHANHPPSLVLAAAGGLEAAVNAPVTVRAEASDEDGDPLSYFWSWDYGDLTFLGNVPEVSRAWSRDGEYTVRCTVTDTKGGICTGSLVVRVGNPTTYRIGGRILRDGIGIEGVRMRTSSKQTHTNSDGSYELVGLGAGNWPVSARKYLHDILPANFSNPVPAGAAGIDWVAVPLSLTISGKVWTGDYTQGQSGIPGAVVTDGTRVAVTDATGSYLLAGLNPGPYNVSASSPGSVFSPVPLYLDADRSDIHFVERLWQVYGQVHGTQDPVTVTDGTHFRTSLLTWNGQNLYNLPVAPGGPWSLGAFAPGRTLLAQNFSNPLDLPLVLEPGQWGYFGPYDFQASPGTSYRITGSVTAEGQPLAGAAVTDGTRSAVSDPFGRFSLANVPDGASVLRISKPGFRFSPREIPVTVSGADSTGHAFSGAVNAPPTIAVRATALPNPIAGTRTRLSVLGADDGGEEGLTYAWSAFGAGPVSFSANGTHDAREATATFSRPGSYLLTAILSDPEGLRASSTTLVVVNPITAVVTVAAHKPEAVEGKKDGKFRFRRTGSTKGTLRIAYSLSGTARNGMDYGTLSGTVTFERGKNSVDVEVRAIKDKQIEADEQVVLTLDLGADYEASPVPAVVSIKDLLLLPPKFQKREGLDEP